MLLILHNSYSKVNFSLRMMYLLFVVKFKLVLHLSINVNSIILTGSGLALLTHCLQSSRLLYAKYCTTQYNHVFMHRLGSRGGLTKTDRINGPRMVCTVIDGWGIWYSYCSNIGICACSVGNGAELKLNWSFDPQVPVMNQSPQKQLISHHHQSRAPSRSLENSGH